MKPPYEITPKILKLYGRINDAIGQCKSLNLVKPEARLRKQNRIKTIHSSLAIEGNTLSVDQVTAIIENNRVAGPKKDIIEVQNAIRAYDALDSLKTLKISKPIKFVVCLALSRSPQPKIAVHVSSTTPPMKRMACG